MVVLTARQRRELVQRVARAADSAQEIRRAQVVLWSAALARARGGVEGGP
jgi:hypothetical protein